MSHDELWSGCIPLGLAEVQGTLADITPLQAKELGWALAASCRAGMGYEQGAGMPWSDASPGRVQLLPQCPGPDFQTCSKDGSWPQQALYSIMADIPSLQPIDPLCWWRLRNQGGRGGVALLETPQCYLSALPTDLLQVLLPLVLALAALHGGPAPPPPADAQPEEPGLQLRGRRGTGLAWAESWENLPQGERSSACRSQAQLGTFFLRTDGEKKKTTKILHSCLHLLVFLFLH